MERHERDGFETIRQRVRDREFRYSEDAARELVEEYLSEEDILRAVNTSALAGTFQDEDGVHYVLEGFSMNEDEVFLVCRVRRGKVRIDHVARI